MTSNFKWEGRMVKSNIICILELGPVLEAYLSFLFFCKVQSNVLTSKQTYKSTQFSTDYKKKKKKSDMWRKILFIPYPSHILDVSLIQNWFWKWTGLSVMAAHTFCVLAPAVGKQRKDCHSCPQPSDKPPPPLHLLSSLIASPPGWK